MDRRTKSVELFRLDTNLVILIRNGGYFHLLLLEELDVYGQPLGNPETGLEERFMNFVLTILSKIDSR
jgi:hypothetical protein